MCDTPNLLSWSELTKHINGRKKERKFTDKIPGACGQTEILIILVAQTELVNSSPPPPPTPVNSYVLARRDYGSGELILSPSRWRRRLSASAVRVRVNTMFKFSSVCIVFFKLFKVLLSYLAYTTLG